MEIKRKDADLNEAIEALDYHLSVHKGNSRMAFLSLGKAEIEFITEEVGKIMEPIVGARYYLENYHVIPTEEQGLTTLCPLWDSQEIFFAEVVSIQGLGRPVKIVSLKARQLGLSTLCQALVFHKTITTEVCNSLVVAQDPGQSDYLFGMSRLAYDMLPWWMRPERRYEAKGKYLVFDRQDDNERQTNPGLKSTIYVESANKMTGVARGKSVRACHLSEISSWENASVLSEQIFPAMNATDELAFMESTALGRANFFYDFWKGAIAGKVDWRPVFIEFFRVKKYFIPVPKDVTFELTEEESAIRSKIKREKDITISDGQFYWRRNKIQEFVATSGDEFKFLQEFPGSTWMEAFQGTGICAFNKKKLQIILETTCCPPLWYGEIDLEIDKAGRKTPKLRLHEAKKGLAVPIAEAYGERLRIWEMPKEQEAYYIAADVGLGVEGGDYSVGQIIRIGRGKEPDVQVAEWHGWIGPSPFASVLYAMGMWYNWAEISVETNGEVGGVANNELFRNLQYDKVFRWKHYDKIKNFITDFFGWSTNSKTRPAIIAKLREGIADGTVVIRSEDLVDELMDFSQAERGGKFQGQSTHDDRALAFMICLFCAHDSDWATEIAATPIDTDKGRKDYFNTEHSPIHDKPGLRHDAVYKNSQRAEDVLYADMQVAPVHEDDNDWKNF